MTRAFEFAVVPVLFGSLVLAIVVMFIAVAMVIAVLGRSSYSQSASQSAQCGPPNKLFHQCLSFVRPPPTWLRGPSSVDAI